MKLKILGKRLLVMELPTNTATQSGIHLPEYTHHDRPKLFRVLQLGSKPVEPKVGDRVICHSHTDGPKPLGDGRMIITEEQILAILPAPQQIHERGNQHHNQ
jgi:co-chaperonin GroES (HSP10)